mgnify:CR=1 FL=1
MNMNGIIERNYAEAEKYRPKAIKTLLIGECPPVNGQYFYIPKANYREIALASTIFMHYFNKTTHERFKYILQ